MIEQHKCTAGYCCTGLIGSVLPQGADGSAQHVDGWHADVASDITHLRASFLQGLFELGGIADERACVGRPVQQQHGRQRLPPLHSLQQ